MSSETGLQVPSDEKLFSIKAVISFRSSSSLRSIVFMLLRSMNKLEVGIMTFYTISPYDARAAFLTQKMISSGSREQVCHVIAIVSIFIFGYMTSPVSMILHQLICEICTEKICLLLRFP